MVDARETEPNRDGWVTKVHARTGREAATAITTHILPACSRASILSCVLLTWNELWLLCRGFRVTDRSSKRKSDSRNCVSIEVARIEMGLERPCFLE